MKVLIIEDDRMVRSLIRRMVERQLAECLGLEASNAEDAALQLARQRVDVMLADIRLPGMNGIELARRARLILPSV